MFAGLNGLVLGEESTITGFTSKEGEQVNLKKEISLIKTPKINDWLTALETNMKLTLAELLAEAYTEFEEIFAAPELDRNRFVEYIDKYPGQIGVLATQCVWTNVVEKSLQDGGAT